MLSALVAVILTSVGLLAACTPSLNWREVRVTPSTLKAMMPCKPDRAARAVEMAGRRVQLEALGCDAGGATFAVLLADLGDASQSGAALAQWKAASLANMRGTGTGERPFAPPGAIALRESLQVTATGQRPNGSKVECRAAYFAQGSRVFQALICADAVNPQAAEPFFSGLRFE